jgi:hypothetical protein
MSHTKKIASRYVSPWKRQSIGSEWLVESKSGLVLELSKGDISVEEPDDDDSITHRAVDFGASDSFTNSTRIRVTG